MGRGAEDHEIFAQREITKTISLAPPEKKEIGHYIIVPNEMTGPLHKEERPFWLRIFSSDKISVVALPQTHQCSEKGEWTLETNGGKRALDNGTENPDWCQNPQFFLNLKENTHLKVSRSFLINIL